MKNLFTSFSRYYRRVPRLTVNFWFKIGCVVTALCLILVVPFSFRHSSESSNIGADGSDAHRNLKRSALNRPKSDLESPKQNQVESPEGNQYNHEAADDVKQIALPGPHGAEVPDAVIDAAPFARDENSGHGGLHDAEQKRNIPAPNRKPVGRLNALTDDTMKRPENDRNKQIVRPPPRKSPKLDEPTENDNEIHDSPEKRDFLVPVFKEGVKGFLEITEAKREGPGEYGVAFHLPESEHANQGNHEFGFNQAASDKISLDRALPDNRPEECKFWHYPSKLPKASVVIAFHNEMWSTLLRTVHSVINRTPPELLEEVLLVDDFSDKVRLKNALDEYIVRFKGKVRIIRNDEREGLIRTRSIGAKKAKGEVVFFLDAHCEVGFNWLPPLLAPIARDHTIMTVPVIDGIDADTFEIHPQYQGKLFRGIFEWGLLYKETELPYKEQKRRAHPSEPYKSPTHAGGLFAINREYFLKLGGYDDGLQIWGGEQYELSFKIWQCGGSIEWVPCSHIGHIYRGFMPYGFGKLAGKGPIVSMNLKRVAEVWMDEYKEYYYIREPLVRDLDHGNISKQKELREKLNCKSFKWYMENVAYDVVEKYPILPANRFWGELRSIPDKWGCWDSGKDAPSKVGVSPCHHAGGHQLVRLNTDGQLGIGERCVEIDHNDQVELIYCPEGKVNGSWEYVDATKQMKYRLKNKCAEKQDDNTLYLKACDSTKDTQQFEFAKIKGR